MIDVFLKFASIVEERKQELSTTISDEMGKPLWESLAEVAAVIGKVAISIEAYEERCPQRVKHIAGGDLVTRHEPHGLCGVLGPFNLPAHLPNGHITPLLLAGNSVVFKPSEKTPRTGELLVSYWHEAGIPKERLQILQGDGAVGKALAEDPKLDALFFTGSAKVGLQLSEHYGKHPDKLLSLEMGGNNPLVVTDVENLEAAAYQTILSAYITSGQRCTCARRLIVVNNDPFIEKLIEMIGKIRVGHYTETPEPFMGPLLDPEPIYEAAKNLGGNPLVPLELNKPALIEVKKTSDSEIFGPILQLIRVPTFDAAIEEANNTRYGLSAALLSRHRPEYERFVREVKAGVINWNRQTTGASSAAPFGGVGFSGNHRPTAYYAADSCSYPIASMESTRLSLPDKLNPGIAL